MPWSERLFNWSFLYITRSFLFISGFPITENNNNDDNDAAAGDDDEHIRIDVKKSNQQPYEEIWIDS